MSVTDIDGYFFNSTMVEYFEKQQLYSLQLEITTACGQGCKFCYVRTPGQPVTHMDGELVLSVLEQAADVGVRVIEWLGGDPVRHPSFEELLAASTALGLTNNIWSSGDMLLSDTVVDFLLDEHTQGFVSFHLDTLDPELYRQLAGASSYIDRVLSNVRTLLDMGVDPARLNNCMTFTRLQADGDLERTVERLFHEYGIASGIVPFKPAPGVPDADRYVPTRGQIRQAYQTISDTVFNGEMPVIPNCVSKFYCGTTCAVTIGGELTPCARIRHPVARLNGSDFAGPFESAKELLLKVPLRDPSHLSAACRNCKYNSICWGCRGNAYYYGGDFLGPDPECWHQQ